MHPEPYLEWQRVFLLAGGVYVFGCVFYSIFADGEVQEWSKRKDDDNRDNELDTKKPLTDIHKDWSLEV